MVRIIEVATFFEGMERTIELIKARQVDLEQTHILVVPDRFTFEAEQKLAQGTGGFFDIEVMTLSRLAKQHCSSQKYLSRQGAVASITEILRENRDELSLYGSVYLKKGFAESILNTINQFKSCRLSPSKIVGGKGALEFKTADLRFIYQKYEEYLSKTGYIDSADILNKLNDYYKSADLSKSHFYFCNFYSMTAQTYAILHTLSNRAKGLTVTAVFDSTNPYLHDSSHITALHEVFNDSYILDKPIGSPFGLFSYALNAYLPKPNAIDNKNKITIYEAKNPVGEWLRVAREIRKRIVHGEMRYGDIGVMVNSAEIDIIERVFGSFDIPFYAEKKFKLSDHPIWDFINSVFSLKDGFKRETVLTLSKNAFLGCDKDALDCFENFVLAHNINYKGFLTEFTKADRLCQKAEQVRKRLMDLNVFVSKLNGINSAREYELIILSLLEFVNAQAFLSDKDGLDTQVFAKLTLVLSQLSAVLLKKLRLEDYQSILENALKACEISLIPLLGDCVLIGAPEMFISDQKRLLFAVGASEGRLPIIREDFGIFSDRDLLELKDSSSLDISPKISFINCEERAKTALAMSIANELFITFPQNTQNGEALKPSPLLAELARCFNNIEKISQNQEENVLFSPNTPLEQSFIQMASSHLSTEQGAKHFLMDALGRYRLGSQPRFAFLGRLLAHTFSDIIDNDVTVAEERISGRIIGNTISPSKIERYFYCPYSFFLENAVRAKPRNDGTIRNLDIGNIIHTILENLVKKKAYDDATKFGRESFKELIKNNASFETISPILLSRIENEAVSACERVASHIKQSSFTPVGAEIEFGKDCRFDAIKLDLDPPLYITGKIDRVDVTDERVQPNYVRVVDYKSGYPVKLEARDVYYGKKLQPLIYLTAVKGKSIPSGALYFKTNIAKTDDSNVHFVGPYIYSDEVVRLYDNVTKAGSCSFINAKRNKDGSLRSNKNTLSTADEMNQLCNYAIAVVTGAIKEILEGNIKKTPLDRACTFCNYKSACGFDQNPRQSSSLTFMRLLEVFNS